MPRGDLHEMSKNEFVSMMKECGLVIIPKTTGDEGGSKKEGKDAKGKKGAAAEKPAEEGKKDEAVVVKFDE